MAMRKAVLSVLLMAASICIAAAVSAEWWNTPYPAAFDASTLTTSLGLIRVEGNQFVDEDGEPVVFRGVAIADPDKLERQGHWSKDIFEEVASWGANVVRIPIHPVAWRARGKAGSLVLLDDALRWSTDLGLYIMVDWHSIGNLETGLFQHPMYDTTKQETLEFWRTIAARYKGIPTMAFYEIFNEPTTYNGQLGATTWAKWKAFNEEVIGVIYAHDREVISLVAGFNWAYELRSVRDDPIDAEGIGYVTHPYPQKVDAPWEEKWEEDFGYVADRYPVVATEFGFYLDGQPGAHIPAIGTAEYGTTVTDYFAKKGISWVAWCFDPDWGPHLISDWSYTPTISGTVFKGVMSGGD